MKAPSFWKQSSHSILSWMLLPFSWVFASLVAARAWAYRCGILKSYKVGLPVIVVGNITTGGAGKTPTLIALYHTLVNNGYRPGIISRGYKGDYQGLQWVSFDSDPREVGDEPLLIARRTGAPVVVCRDRVKAAEAIQLETSCNVILSDDGLQHYRLARDIEIAVVNDLGNKRMLPAGPLREPASRLSSVDIVLDDFVVHPVRFKRLGTQEVKPLDYFKGQTVHALAGIAKPRRFFKTLLSLDITVIKHIFPDHYAFEPGDLAFDDLMPVVMTEKDAIKCEQYDLKNHWFLMVDGVLSKERERQILSKLSKSAS